MFLDGGPDPLCAIQDEGGASRGSINANNGGSETSGSSVDEELSTASESETSSIDSLDKSATKLLTSGSSGVVLLRWSDSSAVTA